MSMRWPSFVLAAVAVTALFAAGGLDSRADEPGPRPRMKQLPPARPSSERPPSPRELVAAREALERRFGGQLASAGSAAGAKALAATLLDAAAGEQDRALKWLMLAEARRLAAATGNAAAVDRSIVLAAAAYEFDAIAEEYRTLRGIPLQALDPERAAALAGVAEGLAQRAAADGRSDLAADSWRLAVRAWQRAGDDDAARRAAESHDEAVRRRPTSRP